MAAVSKNTFKNVQTGKEICNSAVETNCFPRFTTLHTCTCTLCTHHVPWSPDWSPDWTLRSSGAGPGRAGLSYPQLRGRPQQAPRRQSSRSRAAVPTTTHSAETPPQTSAVQCSAVSECRVCSASVSADTSAVRCLASGPARHMQS